MWISAKFHLQVIRAFDAMVNQESNQASRQSTATQLTPLRQKVEELITKGVGNIYPDIWRLVHQQFNVKHINQLKPEQIKEAVCYLDAIEGEYIAKNSQQAAKQTNYYFPIESADPYNRQFGNALITPHVILDERNRAPELELIEALEADGYDVTGAKVRIHAMYGIISRYLQMQMDMSTAMMHINRISDIVKFQSENRGENVIFTGDGKGKSYGGLSKRQLPMR
ncbi:Putative uncharacterized phage-encoded protein [Vibrio anguillarum]|nr:hypothetical protein [Vibrio anguillarum]AOT26234.1 DNA binding protein [Vibrio phage Her]AOT26325.1 DNA binding protein [Vibrio phage Cla]AOT26507.1 DNA binding protein [Vibrio phage Pel]AOT26598.1 DNA binding protein [Vibrio phage pVa-2]AOT26689.1 hypothetical protein pVa1_0078 [Vibrio phage pVa-1]AOT26780.1 DNA binding protein [Vibrio phage vB_VspP_pVa5_12Jun]AOT26871.1 DNA binding protein [Vibrio phage pVa-6]AOT27058.1 DNA binding protein [Vibrio phage Strym]AOT27149.1 DNA binding p